VTLDDFVDHIDHVCQLAGNSLHSAIGGDTDGIQGGAGNVPMEIDTVTDYQKVVDVLDRRGVRKSDVENVRTVRLSANLQTLIILAGRQKNPSG